MGGRVGEAGQQVGGTVFSPRGAHLLGGLAAAPPCGRGSVLPPALLPAAAPGPTPGSRPWGVCPGWGSRRVHN